MQLWHQCMHCNSTTGMLKSKGIHILKSHKDFVVPQVTKCQTDCEFKAIIYFQLNCYLLAAWNLEWPTVTCRWGLSMLCLLFAFCKRTTNALQVFKASQNYPQPTVVLPLQFWLE